VATISFRPTENGGGFRRKILKGFGDRVYYYPTHVSTRESNIFHGLALISNDYKYTSRVIRSKNNFEHLMWLPSIDNIFLFSTDKFSIIEPLSEMKYKKSFFVADGHIHMAFSKNIEPIVEHLKPDFWSISYTDFNLPPVDKTGDLNLLKNIILDCNQHLNLSEKEKKVLLFAIDLGWPETELVNWKNYHIEGDEKILSEILNIYNEKEFGKLLRAAIRKIIYEVQASPSREKALEILKNGVTPTRPHLKLKVLDALFATQPAKDYMGKKYSTTSKKSLLKFNFEKIYISFIRSIPQNIEEKTNKIIMEKFSIEGWKLENIHKLEGQKRFRFHISYTFNETITITEIDIIVREFYDTLKEIYDHYNLNEYLEKGFYSKSEIWIKGVELAVIFKSETPIELLKRSLAQHFKHYLYPYRGPEFEVIPYQTDFKEYSQKGTKRLKLYLYFPRPYDFKFDVKEELPQELDDKTKQAIDYCYFGRFYEAKKFLDNGLEGLTADEYILERRNINKSKEIYNDLEIDIEEKYPKEPKYFVDSTLEDIRLLKKINRRIAKSVDFFIESEDIVREALGEEKEMRNLLLKEAQHLRERAYLPYPSDLTALITILQMLSLEVKNDMKNVILPD